MLLVQIAAMLAATAGLFAAIVRFGWPAAAALLAAAAAIGPLTGIRIDQTLIKGFGETAGAYGLIILAVALIAAALPPGRTTASPARQSRPAGLWSLLGTVSAASGSAAAALLLLAPFAGRDAARTREGTAGGTTMSPSPQALALSLAAARTLLPPNAGPVAAIVILGADPASAVLLLLALAAISGAVAWGVALAGLGLRHAAAAPLPAAAALDTRSAEQRNVAGYEAAILVAAALLLMGAGAVAVSHWQPFGNKTLVENWARPVLVLLAAAAVAWGLARRGGRSGGWPLKPRRRLIQALNHAGQLLLVVSAAGAFAKMLQAAGVAQAASEALIGDGGVLLIFLTAAAVKTLQGSSWVATLMTAGLLHAMPQGLDDGAARLLAVGAICAGSAVVSHANDPYFWMVTHTLRLPPLYGLRLLSLGTLLQGGACAIVLLILEALL